MRLVAVSDTHGLHRQVKLPEGDMLIHSGDITMYGELEILQDFANWLKDLQFKYKIVIFGNHEVGFDRDPDPKAIIKSIPKRNTAIQMIKDTGAIYLENEGIEIEGIKFFGVPNVSGLPKWSFNDSRNLGCWLSIPDDVEVLISHSPPHRILDEVYQYGSEGLRKRVDELMEKKLKLNVFGHCHQDGGKQLARINSRGEEILFVNASTCDRDYEATNPAMVIDI